MDHLFESVDSLHPSEEARLLAGQSLRSMFLWLLVSVFMLGAVSLMMLYQFFHGHRFAWLNVGLLLILGVTAFRHARLIYRRLEPVS